MFQKLSITAMITTVLSLMNIAGSVKAATIHGSFRINGDWGGFNSADVEWWIDKDDLNNANKMNKILFDDGSQDVEANIDAFTFDNKTWEIETMKFFLQGREIDVCLGLSCRKFIPNTDPIKDPFIEGAGSTFGTNEISRIKQNLGDHKPIPENSSTLSLLALGTLSAASTLKCKLKSSKEKDLEKVGDI